MERSIGQQQNQVPIVHGMMLLGLSLLVAAASFILGMMLLSVMGGLNAAARIPGWYNVAMWIGWPLLLAATAIIPGVTLVMSGSWHWPTRLLLGLGGASAVWFLAALILMIGYGLPSS